MLGVDVSTSQDLAEHEEVKVQVNSHVSRDNFFYVRNLLCG